MDSQASAGAPIEDWPLRPWVLAGLLAIAGFLIHFLFDGTNPEPLEAAGTAFLFFGSLCAAFSLGPSRLLGPAIFAVAAGLVMAGLAYNTIAMDDALAGEEFAFFAGVFATLIALPLFQADFHRTRLATDYKLTHFHVWTDAVTAAGALAFTGLSWLLLVLLNGLFDLVGIDIIETLWDEEWFGWMWSGGAFGTALGVLRNNLKVIGALQNVVMIVLSLLAIPLAAALVVFLIALLASGGQALWDATDSATPVLLACAVGCFVLSNAIFRDDDEARSRNKVMQIAALVLAAGVLPLAIFAAISMGIRIDQHGLTPERIWALITIMLATVYGLAYWVGLVRGGLQGWATYLRRANLRLAIASCVVALFLALPILDFGGISARNQVARLNAGTVTAESFDYAALRWDFGDAGRAVLDELAAGEGEVADLAAAARDADVRPSYWEREQRTRELKFHVQSDDPAFEGMARDYLRANPWQCRDYCVVLDLGLTDANQRQAVLVQRYNYTPIRFDSAGPTCVENGAACSPEEAVAAAVEVATATPERPELTEDSQVEIQVLPRRYIVVDGQPLDRPLEDTLGPDARENLLDTIIATE